MNCSTFQKDKTNLNLHASNNSHKKKVKHLKEYEI